MLTPPWRSRKWRTSLLANTFLLGELSTSVNKAFTKCDYTCFTPYSAPRHEGRPAPALLPRHPAAGAGQVSWTNESAASSHVTASSPLIGRAGATDLLLEYEDTFPHWGPLANVSSHSAWSLGDIAALVTAARAHNLTVIPLVQTFGHMEWLLKLARWH